jgi:nitrate reductase alpha subunit
MTSQPTIKPDLANTYHRDGTVSYWDIYCQQWRRDDDPSDEALASMTDAERARMISHCDIGNG